MRPQLLSEHDRESGLRNLREWKFSGEAIHRIFKFADFRAAFAFMTQAAFEAEKMNHHPEWKNVYNRVEVSLSTHDAGGVTELDLKLAAHMDKIYGHGI